MKRKLACAGLVIAALVAFGIFAGFGCGTMANLDGRQAPLISLPWQVPVRPFGGVANDVKWIASGNVFFVADIPFSLVGDVVTLPKVLRKPSDPLLDGIREGETLESEPGRRKINPSAVLKEIPIGSSVEQAQAVMEKHGFSCTHGSTENDEKRAQVPTPPDVPPTNVHAALTTSTARKGNYLHATAFKRTGLLSADLISVTFYYQDGKISDVEVFVRYDGP